MPQIGPYDIISELGEGAMGKVWRAYDSKVQRPIAIKMIKYELFDDLSPAVQLDLKNRFLREAQAAGALSHPGIVTVYRVGEQDGLPYIAMEFVEGVTLDRVFKESSASQPLLLDLLRQIAAALDYAHAHGVIHRDIKPANILVRQDHVVKIADFGIARITTVEGLSRTGSVFGTPLYMSPEQLASKAVTGQSDQFSLGVMAYRALTGQMPFFADTLPALFSQILSQDPPPATSIKPDLRNDVDAVLRRALAKDPAARFRSCSDFISALAAALERPPVTAPLPVAFPSRNWNVPALVACAVVALAGLYYSVNRVSNPELPRASRTVPPQTRPQPEPVPNGTPAVPEKARPKADEPGSRNPPAPPEPAAAVRTKTNPVDGQAYVWIPAGIFRMGCLIMLVEADRPPPVMVEREICRDGKPREVTISQGFWLGQTEVTVQSYRKYAEAKNQSMPGGQAGDRYPVANLSRDQAEGYCEWIGGRLPTEAEWERAARGGKGPFRPTLHSAPAEPVDSVAWYGANSGGKAHEVGQKRPNPYGLYDMLGNVAEWVLDHRGSGSPYDGGGPLIDPKGLVRNGGSTRGGSYITPNESSGVDYWSSRDESEVHDYVGFRCAWEAKVFETPPPKAPAVSGSSAPNQKRQNPKDGLSYVWIPPGRFRMGCSDDDKDCENAERPSHEVTITTGFWLGQTEVTVNAFEAHARDAGVSASFAERGRQAVSSVSWDAAQQYCRWMGGRLPTEAEWEYAARAGSVSSRYGPLDDIAWYGQNRGDAVNSHEVGRKLPNGFGLYDMLGNVSEWVADYFDLGYYRISPGTDPKGPVKGESRVVRGGGQDSYARIVRVSARNWNPQTSQSAGFRCVWE